jgi:PleD family two-component response regulator
MGNPHLPPHLVKLNGVKRFSVCKKVFAATRRLNIFVELPATKETIKIPVKSIRIQAMPEKSLPTVFVVDDEPAIATTLAMILNSSGFSANAFTDPREALRFAETQCPDFLITDVVMPPRKKGHHFNLLTKPVHPQDLLDAIKAL